MKETSKNILAGSWIAHRWEQKISGNKWVLYMELPLENFIWHFGPTNQKKQGFHGKMIRLFAETEPVPENFSYFPSDSKLYIEDPSEDSHDERYRVVSQDNDQLYLYILDDVHREPEDDLFRIVLKKIVHVGD